MAEKKQITPPAQYDLDAKWDACLDLSLRRFCYSSLTGAFGGLLLFRSPATRWASLAFGAGIGIGSAYTECSQRFGGSLTEWTPPSMAPPAPTPPSAPSTPAPSSAPSAPAPPSAPSAPPLEVEEE